MKIKKALQIVFRYWFPPIGFAGLIFLLSLQPELRGPFPNLVDLILRKIGHMTEYFILTILLARVGLRKSKYFLNQLTIISIAALGAIMTAIFDENIQAFVLGREGCFRDVLIDGVGIMIAVFVILYLILKYKNLIAGPFKLN